MAERFTMYHPNGGEAATTQRAYDRIWFDKGWRKSPPKKKNTPNEDPAPAGSSAEKEND